MTKYSTRDGQHETGQQVRLDPVTCTTSSSCLATFARTDAAACDAFWAEQPMGTSLGEAIAAGGTRAAPAAAKVGDASLVLSGLFPNRLRRSLVDVDYYMRIGGTLRLVEPD